LFQTGAAEKRLRVPPTALIAFAINSASSKTCTFGGRPYGAWIDSSNLSQECAAGAASPGLLSLSPPGLDQRHRQLVFMRFRGQPCPARLRM